MKRIISAAESDAVTKRELENREVAYRSALEGIVLLKNSGDALPLEVGKIALYGAGVPMTVKGGTGSGEVNERHAVTILEGMEKAGFEITTRKWISDFEADCNRAYEEWLGGGKSGFDIINHMANPFLAPVGRVISDEDIVSSGCDTAIYVVSRQAGEGADKKLSKGEFNLEKAEIESITKMAKSYKKSILVINSGSYMDIGELDDMVSAVIYYCQQGMEGGSAFADIISGKAYPSGRLSDTWARRYSDVPYGMEYSYLNGNTLQEFYREGIYVGYRYYDTFGITPRYHFGYGLSYTSFDMTTIGAEITGDELALEVQVKNTGEKRGREVVQVYVSPPDGELKKEYQRLVGFAKTGELAPCERQNVKINFSLGYMASYSEKDAAFILERGDYIVRVGASSVDTKASVVISLDENAVVSKLRNICPLRESMVMTAPAVRGNADDLSDAIRLVLRGADVATESVQYKTPEICGEEQVERIMATLSKRDMIELCVGSGLLGMISTKLNYAPGTVGRTTVKLHKKGLINVNLADGPAGLRLLKVSALTKKGRLRFKDGNYMIGAMAYLPPFIKKRVEAKKKDRLLYQFTTSFPVETALAQSWNTGLCEEVGRAISREMEEYSITYWLAPALNIHKNPLCGRNFEYLSEDPVLTGKIAAALTRGIQAVDGLYATVKHFACNNAEDNRNLSDSIVGERALREIYLRGFEICVRESNPKALMTSYNKLNGIYTPESHDLCTSVLRNEWGFDGVVMTDWFSTKANLADAGKAIHAGNDLLMPGTSSDRRSIKKALKNGTATYDELKRCAANIVRSIIFSEASKKNS